MKIGPKIRKRQKLTRQMTWWIRREASIGVVDTQFCIYNLILEDDWNDLSKYPKIMIAFHALNHSSHIIKWSWDSNNHDNTFDFQIEPSDWKISQNQVFMVCMHLLGEVDHVWLIEINFDWSIIKIN